MKITSGQLRKVIKEELRNKLSEGNFFNISKMPEDEITERTETPIKGKFDLSGLGISAQPEVSGVLIQEPDLMADSRAWMYFAGGLFQLGAGGPTASIIKSGAEYPYELYVFSSPPRQHDTAREKAIIKLIIRKA